MQQIQGDFVKMSIKTLTKPDVIHLGASTQTAQCTCPVGACDAWESLGEERWPKAQMQDVGTLRDAALDDPTFEEFHPHGTRYDSADAPVSLAHFPYNRCDLFRCAPCGRVLLKYTEYGGYYVDHRVRELRGSLVV
jgi:hypothetical protein